MTTCLSAHILSKYVTTYISVPSREILVLLVLDGHLVEVVVFLDCLWLCVTGWADISGNSQTRNTTGRSKGNPLACVTYAAASFFWAGAGAAALISLKSTTWTPSCLPSAKLSRYCLISEPFNKIVVALLVKWTACSSADSAKALSRTTKRVDGIGDGRGRADTSSLEEADGMTSLMRSSEAKRSSLSLRWAPREPEGVSVDSAARTRTGVGAAVLAVFGLKRSWIQ